MRGGLAGALLMLCAHGAGAETRRLGVDEAVRLALTNNPQLRSIDARSLAAGDRARSVRGRLLPAVHVFDEYQHWDSPFSIVFQPGAPPFTLRDQDTNTFVASADQPLLGLAHRAEEFRAERANAEASGAQTRVAESQLREAVRAGFLRFFEAQALEQIAHTSVGELAEQVGLAEARLKAGVITNADLLRVQVAQANARQQEIVAHTQADVTRANLLAAIGLPPDDAAIELEEPRALLADAAGPLPALAAAQDSAAHARPELLESRLLLAAADHQRRARVLALLPEIDAEAAYMRIDGQIFAPANSGYVGVKAQWTPWEWGASWYAARATRRLADAARLDLEQSRLRVATEVHAGLSQASAAASAVEVSRAAIASAEEAYRVTNALLKAGSATTTDLLDAQAALTGARLNLARAQYEQAIARVSLERALGH
jgi:outer membrane protein